MAGISRNRRRSMFGKGTKSGGKHAAKQGSTDPRLMVKFIRDPKAVGPKDGTGKHRKDGR